MTFHGTSLLGFSITYGTEHNLWAEAHPLKMASLRSKRKSKKQHKKSKTQKELPKHHLKPRTFTLINKITRRHGRRRGTSQQTRCRVNGAQRAKLRKTHQKMGSGGLAPRRPGVQGVWAEAHSLKMASLRSKRKSKKQHKKAKHKKNYLSTI